jgi:plastocyanin
MKPIYNLLLGCLVMASACQKSNVDDPVFDVEAASLTVKAGEAVKFTFKGDPGLISFYSGEVGNDYAFKDGRVVEAGEVFLSFNTNVQYGSQANQLSVWASTDFNAKYNIADVKAATWTDITARFKLATTTTYLNSGEASLNDVVVDGKPLFIAYKYVMNQPVATLGAGRTWKVQNFQLKSNTSIGTQTLADQVSAGWLLVYEGPKEETRSSITATTITQRANAVNTTAYTEDWAISQPVQPGSVDMGPDRSVPVKGYANSRLEEYTHTYANAGTYKATFVAANSNIHDNKQVLKQLEITVVP